MIKLNRLNGTELLVNEQFIETAEQAPDTVVTMQNGHRYFVKETIEEISQLSQIYLKGIYFGKENNQFND